MKPVAIDLSHFNTVTDLAAAKAAGIVGVIHKASQGTSYRDDKYAINRAGAKRAGLLWGAYHFGTGADVAAQVEWFLKVAAPEPGDLIALDYEDNAASQMTVGQARQFLMLLTVKLGRMPVLYSGNTVKTALGSKNDPEFGSYRLWHAQYPANPDRAVPSCQVSWPMPWLWQYSAKGDVPGIKGDVDVNVYLGTGSLSAEWAGKAAGLVIAPTKPAQPLPDDPGPTTPPAAPGPPMSPAVPATAVGFIAAILAFLHFIVHAF